MAFSLAKHLTVAAAVLSQLIVAQVVLVPLPPSVPGLSATCTAVISASVACNASLLWAGYSGRFESDVTLAGLCTPACTTALSTWTRRITGACGTQRFETALGLAWLPQAYAEQVTERFNTVCLRNSAGQLCNPILRKLAGVDPSNQAATSLLSPAFGCNGCYLSSLQTQLQMPLTSNVRLASMFSLITKSCSSTNYTVTTPTSTVAWSILANATSWSTTLFTPLPTTTASCNGTQYTIRAGDTCNSISASQGIDTVGLLSANKLQAKCGNFPTSGTLCIPTKWKCQVYRVKTNDTCASIADTFSVFWIQIATWNPVVGIACTKISTYVGYELCISNPGGDWVNPNPGLGPSSTAVSRFSYSAHAVTTTYPAVSLETLTGTVNDNSSIPFALGTRLDCFTYFTGSINSTTVSGVVTTTPATCLNVASAYGVAVTDLIAWNPSLSAAACSFNVGQQYCAQYLPLNHTGITPYCRRMQLSGPGDTCYTMMSDYGLQIDQFYAWNPSVGADCGTWLSGYSYCVEVAHFQQPGIVTSCNKFAMANESSWAALPCQIIETQFGLSHARFVAWNPALQANCTGIYWHYDYCVSIPNYKPTYSTTTAFPLDTWTPHPPTGTILSATVSTGASSSTQVTTITSSSTHITTKTSSSAHVTTKTSSSARVTTGTSRTV